MLLFINLSAAQVSLVWSSHQVWTSYCSAQTSLSLRLADWRDQGHVSSFGGGTRTRSSLPFLRSLSRQGSSLGGSALCCRLRPFPFQVFHSQRHLRHWGSWRSRRGSSWRMKVGASSQSRPKSEWSLECGNPWQEPPDCKVQFRLQCRFASKCSSWSVLHLHSCKLQLGTSPCSSLSCLRAKKCVSRP